MALVAPAIAALGPPAADYRAYVYGFDEQPPSCEANIRKLFGAVKARSPLQAEPQSVQRRAV